MKIYVRPARETDLDQMELIAQQAIRYLAEQGSPQWQKGFGPDRKAFLADIQKKASYVMVADDKIVGVSALVTGVDPAYTAIYDGQWRSANTPYISIHRIAINAAIRGQGLSKLFLQLLVTIARNQGYLDIRIDTYAKNEIMQKAILSVGFEYQGMVHFDIPHGERRAYQLELE